MGTAANLEETQVYRTEDLRSWADAPESAPPEDAPESAPELVQHPAPEPAPVAAAAIAAAPVAAAPVAAAPAAAAPVAAPVTAGPVAAATRAHRIASSPRRDRFAGLAGILAVLFVVLAGAVLVTTQNGGPGIAPAAEASPTPAPTEADRGGKNDEKGNCKGKGHGNNCDEGEGD